MPNQGKLEKAKLFNAETNAEALTCMFNPSQLAVTKTNSWNWETVANKNVGTPSFSGGQPATFNLDLFFDTTGTGDDVRQHTSKLLELMKYKDGKKPPKVKFVWGKIVTFQAYIEKVDQTFVLFKEDGTPLRVTAKVAFKQAVDEQLFPPQNPTTLTTPRKLWVVTEGDTLDWIAFQEYGDAEEWRHIAETNQLANPRQLRPGQILSLTPLP